MASGGAYNWNKTYDVGTTYSLDGETLNKISKYICKLEAEGKEYTDNEIQTELADLRLRDKNPTLRDAWDAYQTVLQLTNK